MRLWLYLAGCNGAPIEEYEPISDTDSVAEEAEEGCELVEIQVDGPEDPIVGDEWTVWLRCDGALMTGGMILRFEPPDFAMLNENTATFVTPGTATMKAQMGAFREEMEVTVSD